MVYHLKSNEIKSGINIAIGKSRKLLHDAHLLLNDEWENTHAIGLYTFAIEEYGKALCLKECLSGSRTKKGKYTVPSNIFKSHKIKFKKALGILPAICTNLQIGVYVKSNTSIKPITIREMSISGNSTGLFTISTLANMILRMEIFYVAWNDRNRQWKHELTASKETFEEAIINFENHLNTFNMLKI